MLEYELKDAKDLLADKLDKGQKSMLEVNEDLSFLREQVTPFKLLLIKIDYNNGSKHCAGLQLGC